jgi:hypothetical protein
MDLRGHSAQVAITPGEALARALRVPDRQIPAEMEEQVSLYQSLLAGRRVLVVLDNAATAEQVRPLLPGSASCMAVVTSRCRLSGLAARDGAQRPNLDVLPAAQAVAVLAQSAGAARVDAEPAAARELARLCRRLSLALQIAAERVASRPHSALADLTRALTGARTAWICCVPVTTMPPLSGQCFPGHTALCPPLRPGSSGSWACWPVPTSVPRPLLPSSPRTPPPPASSWKSSPRSTW